MPPKSMQAECQQLGLCYPTQGAPAKLRLQSPHPLWATQQGNPGAVLTVLPHSENTRALSY